MRNFLKSWLWLGLLLPALSAFADPPTKPELERIRAWNDLFLSPTPVFSDSEKQFLWHRYLSKKEFWAREAFFDLPQTKAVLEEARKDVNVFVDQTIAGARKSYPALGRQIPIDPAGDTLLSFQRFWQENNRQKTSMTEAEAERLARQLLEQRYGRLDLQDFNQRREFQRETNRFLMSAEGRKTSPRLNERDFEEWKLSEIQRLKSAREANMESLARLSVEFSPGVLRLSKADGEGRVLRGSPRALMPDDLEGAKFIYRPITLQPREIIQLEGQKRAAVGWFVRLKSGEEFGVESTFGGNVQHELPKSIRPAFSVNEFFRAPPQKRERLLAYFFAGNAEFSFDWLSRQVRHKIRYRPDPREIEAWIASSTRIQTMKDLLLEEMKWGTQLLFARGLMKDPDFWKKRDAEAKAFGAKKFPLGSDKPPKLGLFESLAGMGGWGGGGDLDLTGPRSSLSLSGAAQRAENTAKEAQAAADKNILFKTNKIVPGRGPDFYALFDTTQVADAEEVLDLSGNAGLTVSSAQPFRPLAGLVAVPTPEGHELGSLELKAVSGRKLEAGLDYQILKGKDGYALQMEASDGLYEFRAGFSPKATKTQIAPALASLDKARLAKLQKDLSDANLRALASGLGDLLKKEKVSVFDLESLFRKASLYSYNPEPNISAVMESAKGPFAEFARFADGEGRACFQCDGSNSLFRDFLAQYFGNEAKVKISNVSGFQSPYRSLKESHLHLVTKVEVDGYGPLKLDGTPTRMDRALPGTTERILAQQTKHAQVPEETKPGYVENFRRELQDTKDKFLKVAEPARLQFSKGDPWLNAGKATAVLDGYLSGEKTLQEAGEELKRFLPGRSIEFATHEDFMRSISRLAREESATLAKAKDYAKEHPHIPGGAGYRSTAIVNATEKRLEVLAKAEEYVSGENFAEYRRLASVRAVPCNEMFSVLEK